MGARLTAGKRAAFVAFAITACVPPKAPFTEPQATGTFATLLVQCPAVLLDDRDTRGAFTSESKLTLSFSSVAGSGSIDDPCHREGRPIHLPPGEAQLDASYQERVRPDNTAVEARVGCELPKVSRELRAGVTYVYVVAIPKRDASGRFYGCSVKLAEVQTAAPAASGSASVTPPR